MAYCTFFSFNPLKLFADDQSVSEINENLTGIARLNHRIQRFESGDSSAANDLRDQRDRMVRGLSNLIDVDFYEDQHGMLTVVGPGETLLVDRGNVGLLSASQHSQNNNMYSVYVQNFEGKSPRDITNIVSNGKMKALLDVRDRVIPGLLNSNDEMAKTFVDEFNNNHRQGYGLAEFSSDNGRNFFRAIEEVSGAAMAMEIDDTILTSSNSISVASLANSPGDNVIAHQMIGLKDQRLMSDGTATLNEFYSSFVSNLGQEVLQTDYLNESDKVIHSDLNSRREALSGVSLDEEATDMLRWQAGFTASSKIIAAVDDLLDILMSIKK